MEIKKIITFLILIIFLFTGIKTASAYSANMTVSPRSTTLAAGETIRISIILDGGGTVFNAAKGTVTVSSNLSVQSLTMGDCGFAFVTTPTKENPSFAGVILGGSSNKCTIYTLSLKALSQGTGTVAITNASLKAFKGAAEILSFAQDGSYSIVGGKTSNNSLNTDIPTEAPIISNGIKLYEVLYSVPFSRGVTPSDFKIVMDPNMPNPVIASTILSPNDPNVLVGKFYKVPQGIHTIETLRKGSSVSKQIVNIQGKNGKLELGITPLEKKSMVFWYITAATALIVILVIGIFIFLTTRKAINPPNQ